VPPLSGNGIAERRVMVRYLRFNHLLLDDTS
jgi:hypothetical protein